MRILLVEDEKRLSAVTKKGLLEQGFAVDQAFDGEEGQYLAENETYDLIILDLSLPRRDGLTICKNLRQKSIKTPILMLTAKSRVEDKVMGLDIGADDYLTKPFSFLELRSRIQALIRRSKSEISPIVQIDDLEIDSAKRRVKRSGREISLTPKEFAILELLGRYKNEVVTRTQISEHVWDYNFDALSNVVDVFMASLRRKIDRQAKIKLIHTVHGVGYRLGKR